MSFRQLPLVTLPKKVNKRFYSTKVDNAIMMSLQQDICHYQGLLSLDEGIGVDSATVNIRIKESKNEMFHYYKESGFIAIYPFFSFNEKYSLHVMKGSHKTKKKVMNNSFHTVIDEDKYSFVHLDIHKGQFILLNTNLVFADEGCPDDNVYAFWYLLPLFQLHTFLFMLTLD